MKKSLILLGMSLLAACGVQKTELPLLPEEAFQTTVDGKPVALYTLHAGDITMQVTNYGARVVSLWTPDREGRYEDIVLGYENIGRYTDNTGERFLGAVVGPYANRIAKGRFTLDGVEYTLPVNNNGQVNFAAWFEGCNADIETLKTVKSPKDMFFPQSETLYTVKKEQHKLSVEPQTLADQNFVAFGMKACDIQGIKVLDKVFLAEPVDTFYRARREHGTIVALACHEPEESCFCKVFGVDCAEPDADVVMWNANDTLYWKAVTDKGTALTEALSGVLENADAADEKAVETEQENIRAIVEKLPYTNLSLEGWNGNVTEEKFNSPVWEKLYKPCLACGTCTFVCPTCQCYDIKDYDTGHGIQRYRCWDSCMYSDFTKTAGGQPRKTQLERFRQRFMHKLVYYPANNDGLFSCVGCGRCVAKCPISMNIAKVIKRIGGKN